MCVCKERAHVPSVAVRGQFAEVDSLLPPLRVLWALYAVRLLWQVPSPAVPTSPEQEGILLSQSYSAHFQTGVWYIAGGEEGQSLEAHHGLGTGPEPQGCRKGQSKVIAVPPHARAIPGPNNY